MSQEASTMSSSTINNPYVGPRTFTYQESHIFFGRDREARDLISLVISQRFVLFYAQSGAGKSSLVNARLIPSLQEEGFTVLPIGRVGGALPSDIGQVRNVFLFNLMLSLDQLNTDPKLLADLLLMERPLNHFLERLTTEDGESWYYDNSGPNDAGAASVSLRQGDLPDTDEALSVEQRDALPQGNETSIKLAPSYVLIIDQFEEIINTYLERWDERVYFFEELEAAMQADPSLWVLLVLREDYVASLEPYAPMMAEKMRARYYMERMSAAAAYEAICKPAKLGGRSFATDAAEQLVDNLRQIRIPGQKQSQTGQYVEPVQLQVVCYQLWENLNATDALVASHIANQITIADLDQFGNVDRALADFYTSALEKVLKQAEGHVSEFSLRNWFSRQLITEAGTRGLIFQGDTETNGVPNEIVAKLAQTYLVRSELRAGGIWFELVHDRFIIPILQANQAWIRHQSPLLRAVQAWLDSSREPSLLFKGRLLQGAQREAQLAPYDQLIAEFLAASEARAEAEQRQFWQQSEPAQYRLPEFDRSFAVVIQMPTANELSGVGPEPSQIIAAFCEALRTDHGYFTHLQQEEVLRQWLIELFTEFLPKELSENDRLLVYIAGTGICRPVSDTEFDSYLIPQDGSPDQLDDLISVVQISNWLIELKCRHTLLIFDAVFTEILSLPYVHTPVTTPGVMHQAQYDWYVKKPAYQLISVPGDKATTGNLPFAELFLSRLTRARIPDDHAGLITAIELLQDFKQRLDEKGQLDHLTFNASLMWNLTPQSWGEYLFVVPRQELRTLLPAPIETHNPYLGLEPYDHNDAQLFFGRTRLINELTEKVKSNPLTVVLGPSGVGKSSLVKAGLAPHLTNQPLTTGKRVTWQVLSPIRPVNAPLYLLANRIRSELEIDIQLTPDLTSKQVADRLSQPLHSWFQQHPDKVLLLIIDQLEELVTMRREQTESEQFIALMARLLENYADQLRIVFTIRSDFEPHFTGPELGHPLQPYWSTARYFVKPMNRAELRDVIELPAAAYYLDIMPPELVDILIDEVEQTPGALSLLSFTLSELYVEYLGREQTARATGKATARALTLADYDKLGGVIGSLSRRATALYDRLDAEHQATMQRIMLRMIAVDGGELARRRVPRTELDFPLVVENQRVESVIEQMAAAQLIQEGADELGVAYVEPAHDALIRGWDKLLVWKRNIEDMLPLQRRLTEVANEWENIAEAKKAELLWHNDPRLPQLQQVLSPTPPTRGLLTGFLNSMRATLWPSTAITDAPTWLNRVETRFVQQSINRRARNLRFISGLIFAVVLLFAALTIFASYSSRQATIARATAESNEETAKFARETAVMARETAEANATVAISAQETAEYAQQMAISEARAADQSAQVARESEAKAAYLRSVARSRQLAALSAIELRRQAFDLGLLVALEARYALSMTKNSSLGDSQEAYSAIRNALTYVYPKQIQFDTKGDVLQATWSKGERRVLIRIDHGPAMIWDTRTGESVSFTHDRISGASGCPGVTSSIWEATWSKDEKRLLTRGGDGTARIWDAKTGKELVPTLSSQARSNWEIVMAPIPKPTPTPGSEPTSTPAPGITPTPSFSMLCVFRNKETLKISYEIGSTSDDMWQATWSQDEKRVLTRSPHEVIIWDAETGEALANLQGHEGEIWQATWNRAESLILTSSNDNTARIWDAKTGKELVRFKGHRGDVWPALWNHDETRVLTRSSDATVRVWDAKTGQELLRLDGGTTLLKDAIWSRDEQKILTYGGNIARIWDATTGEELARLDGHTGPLLQATWSPDESRILTRADDHTARVWDAKSGLELAKLDGDTGNILQATWNHDGRRVLATSDNGFAYVWDIQSDQEPLRLIGHGDIVWQATWSQDESRILTRGHDDTVRIWDAQTGKELVRLTGHLADIKEAKWSRDESRVLTYGVDNTVRIWYTNQEQLIATACQQVRSNMTWQEWSHFMPPDDKYRPTCVGAQLPPDVIQGIKGEIDAFIAQNRLSEALVRSDELDFWLLKAGQGELSPLASVLETIEHKMRERIMVNALTDAFALFNQLDQWRIGTGRRAPSANSPEQRFAQVLWTIGADLARSGNITSAITQLRNAQAYDARLTGDAERIARRLAGIEWLTRGLVLVDTLAVDKVTAALQRAHEFDPQLQIEPSWIASQLIGHLLINQGIALALQGERNTASAKFERALTLIKAGHFALQDPAQSNDTPLITDARQLLEQKGEIIEALNRLDQERIRRSVTEQTRGLARTAKNVLDKGQPKLALLLLLEANRALRNIGVSTVDDYQGIYTTIRAAITRIQLLASAPSIQYTLGANVWQATWNKDESKVLVRQEHGRLGLWDLTGNQDWSTFTEYDNITKEGVAVWQATWSHNEKRILSYGANGTVQIWDALTGAELVRFRGHTGDVWQATWSKDEQQVLTRAADGTVRIWDAESGKELIKLTGHTGAVWGAIWSEDERRILTFSNDNTARIWDALTGALLAVLNHDSDVWQVNWSKDGTRILTRSADHTVRLWDAVTFQELIRLDSGATPFALAQWSQDESHILTYANAIVQIWDAQTGQELVRLIGHQGELWQATWNADETRVLTRSADQTARIWDAESGQQLAVLRGHTAAMIQATWSYDDKLILTASVDGTVRIWDAITGSEVSRLIGHSGAVREAIWSRDSSRILTRGADQTVRLWDARTGAELNRFVGHTDRIQQATWSQDERRVLTRSDDDTIRIWYTDENDLMNLACQQISENMSLRDWQSYMGDEIWHRTCKSANVPADLAQTVRKQVREAMLGYPRTEFLVRGMMRLIRGDVQQAIAYFRMAWQGDSSPLEAENFSSLPKATAASINSTERSQETSPQGITVRGMIGSWVPRLNLAVIPIDRRPDQPSSGARYVVRDIFTTRDGSWEPTDALGSIDHWAHIYLRPVGVGDYFDDAGGSHHLFAAVIGRDFKLIPEKEILFWPGGIEQLADSACMNYTVVATEQGSKWANLPLDSNAAYGLDNDSSGPWCWAPSGAAEVVCGGGLPDNLPISTFVVWQEVPADEVPTVADQQPALPATPPLASSTSIEAIPTPVAPSVTTPVTSETLLRPSSSGSPAANSPLVESRYIFGLNDPGGENYMIQAGKPGWIVFTEAIGSKSGKPMGRDFTPWRNQGLGVIVNLVNGYNLEGTLPLRSQYGEFGQRCAAFVKNSQGANIWVIGNEMNNRLEHPAEGNGNREMITPQHYAQAYTLCRNAIHGLPGHANDQIIIGAVAPWNNQTSYPGNRTGDWVQYFADIINEVGPTGTDGFALHSYTHGSEPSLITADTKMKPPFDTRHYDFRAYQDFMEAIPANMHHLPVYITETNQNVPWLDGNNRWIQQAYAEINFWNQQAGNQQIRALVLNRWSKLDRCFIEGKTGVIEDFRQALQHNYQWTDSTDR